MPMHVKEAIIRLEKKKKIIIREIPKQWEWPNQQFGTFFKRKNPLASSATPKCLEHTLVKKKAFTSSS